MEAHVLVNSDTMVWNAGKNASGTTYYWNKAGESQYDRPADFDELVARHEMERWAAMPNDAGIDDGVLDNMAAYIAAAANNEEREPMSTMKMSLQEEIDNAIRRRGSDGGGAESDARSSRGGRGRGSSRAGSEVASDVGATSLARKHGGGGGEGGGGPAKEPEPDYVQYAVTGPAVVEDFARSFVVQVWAMIAANMALFKTAFELSGDTDKIFARTLDELERTVMNLEVTVIVTGCTVKPATQLMHWNRKIKSVYHEVFIPPHVIDSQFYGTVIIRPIPNGPILFNALFKIFRRAQSMQSFILPYPHIGSSVLQGSDAILERLNLVEQQLLIQREQNATTASAIASASASAGRASCTAQYAAQALQRKLGVHPDLVEKVKRASVRIGLLDRTKCRLLELGSGTIIDAGAGAPRNQVLTVAHLFVDPVAYTQDFTHDYTQGNPHYLEPIWTKLGYPAAINWTSDAAPLILAIGIWEADDQPSRWMWWAELVTPLATLQEKCQSPHPPHSMTHMLDLAVLRICGRLELTPDVFQGFMMDYSVIAKYPVMASLTGASSALPCGLQLGDPDALQVSADVITVFGWFSPLGEVTLFAPQAVTLAAKSHGLLQASVVLHSGGSGGAAVDHLGRLVAVNWRSGLPELPPRRNYMAYMRMVSWLLPEHGLVISELPQVARDADGNAAHVRPTAVSAVPCRRPGPEWPPPLEGGTVWNEDEDTELRRRLAAFQADGLRRVDVIGDGNCFFRALAKQVNGDEQLHGRARQETIRYMREHREEFDQFVHSVDFDSYVDRMSREGTYVEGEIELMAAAKTFNVRIRVYGRSANHDRTFEPLECNLETRDVYMAHYQAAQHYVVLEQMDPAPTA